MKNYIASLAIMLMLVGTMPTSAQNQAPLPPSPDPYGQGQDQANSQDPNSPAPNQQDGPQPGMARLSFMQGEVSSQRGDNGDWVAATLNTPVAVGDRVSTGQGGRAEVQLDYADALRLSDNATAKVANLTRQNIQIQVGQGLVNYSVRNGAEAATEIDTPNAAIHPNGPGEYRILVNSNSETEVIVREGSAEITEPQGSTQVERGEMITIQGTDNPQYKTDSAPAGDDWDSWNAARDARINGAQSWQKTDRYYTGSEDLDKNGTWSEVPDYGQVWTPAEGPGWTPYSDGRWVYEPYYGWTWAGYEPWGWAPYHYGRWFVYGGNWAWWPGPVYGYPGYYPIWSPAYVSFFGWGGVGFGVGFGFGWGFGHIGWLPCGPGDWFHPWWGGWGGRFNAFNVTNIHNTTVNNFHNGFGPLGPKGEHSFSNVNEAFTNARVRAGMTSMDSSRFGRDAVSGHGPAMSEAAFRQTSMVSGKMPITPSKESFSPSGRAANPSAIRNVPPSSQHFFSGGARANAGVNSAAQRSFGNTNQAAARGQTGFGGNRSGNGNNSASVQSSRPGWHTFTPPQSSGANRSTQGFGTNNGFHQPTSASRGGSSNSHSRPPLNMRQPIVTPRGGPNGRYNAPRGPYSQPRAGGYSAPHPAYSAPRSGGYSAPHPAYSAPRSGGGGGSSRGGGASHSGGGHSGGHSR